MGKGMGILSILLLSFVMSYILTSAFAHYGINTSSLITGFLIVGATFSLVTLFEKIFPGRPKEAS